MVVGAILSEAGWEIVDLMLTLCCSWSTWYFLAILRALIWPGPD